MRITRASRPQPPGDDEFRTDFDAPARRPWFGPKRFGYGIRPQTWQGYLVVGILVLAVIIVSAVFRGRFPPALIAIPVILIAAAIRLFQRR